VWARVSTIHPDGVLGAGLLRLRNAWQRLRWRPRDAAEKAQKETIRRIAPFTMVDVPRLRTLLQLSERLVADDVEGAIVECGCWRGGTLALLDWNVRRLGSPRPIVAFDSFAGLPRPGIHDGEEARAAYAPGWCLATPRDLERAARRCGGSTEAWRVIPGWFSDTLPRCDTGEIALLNIDADWYESVRSCLVHLYERVVPGGFVAIDDYGRWPGCDRAVDEILAASGDEVHLVRESRYGAYWRHGYPRSEEGTLP
jgi:O-methyltransferase